MANVPSTVRLRHPAFRARLRSYGATRRTQSTGTRRKLTASQRAREERRAKRAEHGTRRSSKRASRRHLAPMRRSASLRHTDAAQPAITKHHTEGRRASPRRRATEAPRGTRADARVITGRRIGDMGDGGPAKARRGSVDVRCADDPEGAAHGDAPAPPDGRRWRRLHPTRQGLCSAAAHGVATRYRCAEQASDRDRTLTCAISSVGRDLRGAVAARMLRCARRGRGARATITLWQLRAALLLLLLLHVLHVQRRYTPRACPARTSTPGTSTPPLPLISPAAARDRCCSTGQGVPSAEEQPPSCVRAMAKLR